MRGSLVIGVAAVIGIFTLSPANAERVCKKVCDDGVCTEKCVQHDEEITIDRDRGADRIVRERQTRPGVEFHVPGVGIELGR